MDDFVRGLGYDGAHFHIQDRANVEFLARALGVSEAEVMEAMEIAGSSPEAVFSYFNWPD